MNLTFHFYKVYIDEGVFLLIHTADKDYITEGNEQQVMYAYDGKIPKLLKHIEKLEKGKLTRVVVYSDDLEALWKDFKTHYRQVHAAGGLVVNPKNKILFIYRRKMWDLPKGKLEKKEGRKEGAIREVQEECGLKNLKLIKKINTTYHTYGSKGNRKLKDSHWYLMESDDKELIPQKEEGIEDCRWLSIKEFSSVPRPIYISILDVIQKYQIMRIWPKKEKATTKT